MTLTIDNSGVAIRKAEISDIPAIETLIPESVRALQAHDYSPEQMEGAIGTIFGVDRTLIGDGTYFVAKVDAGVVACGGWSKRRTLFGSDHVPGKDDARLDPAVDAARIRAFFVHPAWSRRGIGSLIMRACENAAISEGFKRLELAATLTGVRLFGAHGFQPAERLDIPLPNGATLPIVRMTKDLKQNLGPQMNAEKR